MSLEEKALVHLGIVLGLNMNVSTLTPKAITEIMADFAKAQIKIKLGEAAERAKIEVIENGKYDARALNNFHCIIDKKSIAETPLD
jgi:hypothetical protein